MLLHFFYFISTLVVGIIKFKGNLIVHFFHILLEKNCIRKMILSEKIKITFFKCQKKDRSYTVNIETSKRGCNCSNTTSKQDVLMIKNQ